jgi:hypothetical protein
MLTGYESERDDKTVEDDVQPGPQNSAELEEQAFSKEEEKQLRYVNPSDLFHLPHCGALLRDAISFHLQDKVTLTYVLLNG